MVQAGGGGAVLLLSSMLWPPSPPEPPAVPSEQLSEYLESRATDYDGLGIDFDAEDCALFNGSLFDNESCNKLVVSRVLPAAIARAEKRAIGCAALLETDCLFGEEVGLRMPIAFVYSAETGVRHLLAPRILGAGENATERRVRMVSPVDGRPVTDYVLANTSVLVEYLEKGKRGGVFLKTEEMRGRDAYCVAFLRRAYSDACWESLD
jgi:hypothetical protein